MVPISSGFTVQMTFSESIVHGHVFMFGAFIPMVWSLMLFFGKFIIASPEANDIKPRSLNISMIMYYSGVVMSIILLFYKALHTEILSTSVPASMDALVYVNQNLFGGNTGKIELMNEICFIEI